MTEKDDLLRKNYEEDMRRCGLVSKEEALEILQRFVDGHFGNTGKEGPRISIPADPMRDDDIRMGAYINQAEMRILNLQHELEAVMAELVEAHRFPTASTPEVPGRRSNQPAQGGLLRRLFREVRSVLVASETEFLETKLRSLENHLKSRFNMAAFFDEKAAWSERTFGSAERYGGIIAHIRKELVEIENNPSDLEEWIDVVQLAMDGAWRSAGADGESFVEALMAKHKKNLLRRWSVSPDGVAEHIRTTEEKA